MRCQVWSGFVVTLQLMANTHFASLKRQTVKLAANTRGAPAYRWMMSSLSEWKSAPVRSSSTHATVLPSPARGTDGRLCPQRQCCLRFLLSRSIRAESAAARKQKKTAAAYIHFAAIQNVATGRKFGIWYI